MFDAISSFALLGAIAVISIGGARIVSWVLDWRAHTASSRIREQAFAAQAHAGLQARADADAELWADLDGDDCEVSRG